MSTKMSPYDVRRRNHGEMLEETVLEELIIDKVIEPIYQWENLFRPQRAQPFFATKNGSSEQPLDEVAYVYDKYYRRKKACIIEIKAMRAVDWHDWKTNNIMHVDKLQQHRKHIYNAKVHKLDGVCIITVNKDSSEYWIKCFNKDNLPMEAWDYPY